MKSLMMTLFMAILLFLTGCAQKQHQELVIYSSRNEHLITPLFKAYTKETGVKITHLNDKAPALIQRLKAEGADTPADLLITVDAGNLWLAKSEGLFKPLDSTVLKANIPSHLRDHTNQWFGLSLRARTIVYHTDRVSSANLSTYEDLGNPRWKGRLLLRTSKKVYTQSLTSMLISQHGVKQTKAILKQWLANVDEPIFHSDTRLIEGILAGQGDIGVVNTYYLGRLLKKDPNLPVTLFWPDQDSGGVHVNVSGAGVLKHSQHPELAQAFLEWLSGPTAQKLFAELNLEYPVNPKADIDPLVASWGPFEQNKTSLSRIGALQPQSIRLMDEIGYP